MGIIAINNTVPKKLIISVLLVKKENDCCPSSKYQMAEATIAESTTNIMGKIRQQYLFVFIVKGFKRNGLSDTFNFCSDYNCFCIRRIS